MKRLIALLLCLTLFLSGCSSQPQNEAEKELTIYASFYPVYALAAAIVSDIPGMRLHQLVQPQDGCLRNYTLSDWDLYTASNADALILAGSGLESFADTVSSLGENGPAVARVLGSLVLRTEEWGSAHFSGVNPWLFLSVEGARQISEAIAANMLELDPACENLYLANLHAADERLSALKTEMADILAGANLTAPVAVLHEGLFYLADEWSLNVVTAIERESGDTLSEEALETLSQSGARVVLIEKQSPEALVKRLEADGYRVALIDTLSTGNETMGADGYYAAMKHVTVYTDGACSGNPGPGGWGAVLIYGEMRREMSGAEANTTNNRMELTAAIKALEALKMACTVDLYSDSAYLINAYRQNWLTNWVRRGWLKADKKPVENVDLWKRLLELSSFHTVTWHKVKGHADNPENNLCDRLATDAVKRLRQA